MHKFTKKRIAIGAIGLLVVAGVAVAYFTTTGSGKGSAEVGHKSALTITAEVTGGKLYPGTSSAVTFKVTNPSPGHQYVNTISLTGVKAYPSQVKAEAEEEEIAACLSSWFKMTETPVSIEDDVPTGGPTTLTPASPAKLEFKNESTAQNACEDAYLVASFTSN